MVASSADVMHVGRAVGALTLAARNQILQRPRRELPPQAGQRSAALAEEPRLPGPDSGDPSRSVRASRLATGGKPHRSPDREPPRELHVVCNPPPRWRAQLG